MNTLTLELDTLLLIVDSTVKYGRATYPDKA